MKKKLTLQEIKKIKADREKQVKEIVRK